MVVWSYQILAFGECLVPRQDGCFNRFRAKVEDISAQELIRDHIPPSCSRVSNCHKVVLVGFVSEASQFRPLSFQEVGSWVE